MTKDKQTDHYPSRTERSPRLRKRKDPVVYSEWTPEAPLSEAQTRCYAEEGYVVLENRFSAEEIAMLKVESMRLRAQPDSLQPETLVSEPGLSGYAEIHSIFAIHAQNRLFGRLSADARIVEVARFLLGDEVYVHQSRLDYKPAFRGSQTFWRSDFETWHVEDGMPRMRAAAVLLLLTESSPSNGPIMFLTGSHRQFVSCIAGADDGTPDNDNLSTLAQSGIAMPTGSPGTLIVFDSNAMRGSNSNITPLPRSNALLTFNAVSNAPPGPGAGRSRRQEHLASRWAGEALEPVRGSLEVPRR